MPANWPIRSWRAMSVDAGFGRGVVLDSIKDRESPFRFRGSQPDQAGGKPILNCEHDGCDGLAVNHRSRWRFCLTHQALICVNAYEHVLQRVDGSDAASREVRY